MRCRALQQRLRAACPDHATLDIEMWPPARPGHVDPSHPVLQAGFDAIERATGARPLAVRSGGTIPVARRSRPVASPPSCQRVRHRRRQHPLAQRADGAAPARLGDGIGAEIFRALPGVV